MLTPFIITTKGWEVRLHEKPKQTAFPGEHEKQLVDDIIEKLREKVTVDYVLIKQLFEEHRAKMIEEDQRVFAKWKLSDRTFSVSFIRKFLKRQKEYLCMRRINLVESIRTSATRAENIGSFFALLKLVYQEHNITSANQIYSLDETGFTPSTDMTTSFVSRTVCLATERRMEENPRFAYSNRITVLGCICADGTRAVPMFVFK